MTDKPERKCVYCDDVIDDKFFSLTYTPNGKILCGRCSRGVASHWHSFELRLDGQINAAIQKHIAECHVDGGAE